MPDVFRVGVSFVANHSGFMGALGAIAGRMSAIHGQANAINSTFGSWGKTLGVVGGILATGAIIKGFESIAKAGAEVNHQLNLMQQAGMKPSEIAAMQIQAKKTASEVLTTTYAENLKNLRELRYAFGDSDVAAGHLSEVAKANAVLNAVRGGKGHDEVWELVKSLESKGLTFDPKQFDSYVNTMTKVVQATGGKVTPQMFMGTMKYGRTATLGWSEEFIGGALPRLIQEYASAGGMGGGGSGGPGNALMSAYAKVVQEQMSKTAAEEFQRMGLGTAKHIKGSSQSQITGIPGRDLFIKDPYEWVQQVLMPALSKKGITSESAILAELSKMFQVRTASDIMAKMALQGRFREGAQSPFEKDIALQKGAMGIQGYDELITKDYDTVMKAFHQQFKSLKEVLGDPLMAPNGPVIKALAGITSAMGSIAKFAGDHPEGVKIALEAVAAFLAALAAAGLVALGVALAPLVGTGGLIFGVVSALAALAALNWGSITAGISSVIDKLRNFLGLGAKPNQGDAQEFGKALKDQGYTPMRFNPAKEQTLKAQPISLSLNLDGRTLAQAIVDQIMYTMQNPTGAPSPDGMRMFRPADGNI